MLLKVLGFRALGLGLRVSEGFRAFGHFSFTVWASGVAGFRFRVLVSGVALRGSHIRESFGFRVLHVGFRFGV